MVPPLCRTDCFKRSFFNTIMWSSLTSNVRHITNYSSFISNLKRLMFAKMEIPVLSVLIVVHVSFLGLLCNSRLSRLFYNGLVQIEVCLVGTTVTSKGSNKKKINLFSFPPTHVYTYYLYSSNIVRPYIIYLMHICMLSGI